MHIFKSLYIKRSYLIINRHNNSNIRLILHNNKTKNNLLKAIIIIINKTIYKFKNNILRPYTMYLFIFFSFYNHRNISALIIYFYLCFYFQNNFDILFWVYIFLSNKNKPLSLLIHNNVWNTTEFPSRGRCVVGGAEVEEVVY